VCKWLSLQLECVYFPSPVHSETCKWATHCYYARPSPFSNLMPQLHCLCVLSYTSICCLSCTYYYICRILPQYTSMKQPMMIYQRKILQKFQFQKEPTLTLKHPRKTLKPTQRRSPLSRTPTNKFYAMVSLLATMQRLRTQKKKTKCPMKMCLNHL